MPVLNWLSGIFVDTFTTIIFAPFLRGHLVSATVANANIDWVGVGNHFAVAVWA